MAGWDELHRLLRRAQALAREIEAGEAAGSDGPGWSAWGSGASPCYPRAYLARRLPAELARAERFGRPLALALLVFDEPLLAGDPPRGLEAALREALDPFDVPVRYSAHRLVLLLPEAGRDEARRKAERLAAALATEGAADRPPRIGVVVHPEQGRSAEELLEALEDEVDQQRGASRGGSAGPGREALEATEAVEAPAGETHPASLNGTLPRGEPESGPEELVAVGFAVDRRLPLSFWRGEKLHIIHAILADETSASGSRRLSVLTDGGEFLLFERDGRWYAEALPPSNGQLPPGPAHRTP